jgi:hypothetical protein
VRQLLDAGDPVLERVEARLEQPKGEGREVVHLAAPGHGLTLELIGRDHGVDQSHVERLLGTVEPAEEPDLLGALGADLAGEEPGAEPAVEAADPRSGLPENRVLGGDRQVADEVEDVTAADGVAGHGRDDGLRGAPHLHVQVAHVQPADPLLGDLVGADIAVVATDLLVATGAEGLVSGAGEDDRADLEVVAGPGEGVAELRQGRWTEGVAALGTVDRDLRDPVGLLVEDVLIGAGALPFDRCVELLLGRRVLVSFRHLCFRRCRGAGARRGTAEVKRQR